MDADLVEFSQHVEGLSFTQLLTTDGGNQVAAVPSGRSLVSLKKFDDELRLVPERMKGTATVTDLPSFIALVNRNKDAVQLPEITEEQAAKEPLDARASRSALFARKQAPQLTAVLNYGDPNDPLFGDHKVVYPFPVSKEWLAWTGGDGKKMTQADFAAFLEDRIVDVSDPPLMGDGADPTNPIVQFARTVGGAFANPQKLLELSRGMAVSSGVEVANAVNLNNGEARITFKETHTDAKGAPLLVPSMFVIAIPVFENGMFYRIGARLRYRVANGQIGWFYQLYRSDLAFEDAFREACSSASLETQLQLFYGQPESINARSPE